MQFSRAVLSKDLRILDTLNKEPVKKISTLKEHHSEGLLLP